MSGTCGYAAAAAIVALAACGGAPREQPRPQPAAASASIAQPAPPAAPSPAGEPPLPVVPFPAARPMPIVEAVFRFAADHPEVLSHIPCFCGCESRGHRHNDDCFVADRDQRGRVTAWEPHGIG